MKLSSLSEVRKLADQLYATRQLMAAEKVSITQNWTSQNTIEVSQQVVKAIIGTRKLEIIARLKELGVEIDGEL